MWNSHLSDLYYRRMLSWLVAGSALLSLVSCGDRSGKEPPTTLSRFPEQLSNIQLQPNGVFEDGWLAQTSEVTLTSPRGRHTLIIRGMVPQIGGAVFHTELLVSIDERPIARQPLGTGDFALEIPTPVGAGRHRVSMAFSNAQTLPVGDGRQVGARLALVGFDATAERKPGSEIVRAGTGIRLGSGWDVLETFEKHTFRWVNNDAHIAVMGLTNGIRRLSITAGPGPGLGGQPLVLRVLDASGRQVDAAEFIKPGEQSVFLPVEAGKESEFQLHVDGGGKAAAKDPRILNFRVFEIQAQ